MNDDPTKKKKEGDQMNKDANENRLEEMLVEELERQKWLSEGCVMAAPRREPITAKDAEELANVATKHLRILLSAVSAISGGEVDCWGKTVSIAYRGER